MRVSELPNGKIEVHTQDVSDDSVDLKSYLKMIEKHDTYSNLDSWLTK